MNRSKMTLKELPEAVGAYLDKRANGDDMTALMALLQNQTEAYQNKFWRAVEIELNK
jgi:hypothetical protein